MDPWKIIGWMILIVVIAIVILVIINVVSRKILFRQIWEAQRDLRKEIPKRYQIWKSLNSDATYYINGDANGLTGSILISSDANNMGGTYYKLTDWRDLVERKRLVLM